MNQQPKKPYKLKRIDDRSAEALANAIIAQAVKDYCNARMDYQDPTYRTGKFNEDYGTFFRSSWFEELSQGLDGESIIRKLDKKSDEFIKTSDSLQPVFWQSQEEAESCSFTCPFCGGKVMVTYQQWVRVRNKGRPGRNNGFSIVERFVRHGCDYCGTRRKVFWQHRNVWREEWENWLIRRRYLLCSAATAASEQPRQTATSAKTATIDTA